jgi:hypothetical protein
MEDVAMKQKLDIHELRIGNVVMEKESKEIFTIQRISMNDLGHGYINGCEFENILPVKITKVRLEKLGFSDITSEKDKLNMLYMKICPSFDWQISYIFYINEWNGEIRHSVYSGNEFSHIGMTYTFSGKDFYIHSLQNKIFDFTGIMLEYKP